MKVSVSIVSMCLLALCLRAAEPADYSSLTNQAEQLYGEGSYARAHELYGRARELSNLSSNDVRWVAFRFADTQWRAQAATQTSDTTLLDAARRELEILVRDIVRVEDRDRVWAEVQESLGDFFWIRRDQHNWGEAWPRYQQALDWWAGARDIELARQRYLAMVWKMARPPQAQPFYTYPAWGNYIPLEVLQNTLRIAQTDEDKAHAHYLIAMTLRNQAGLWEQRARIPEEFEAAIAIGRKTDWYDDALYHYAEWMTGQGRFIPLENGTWRSEPDYPRALELFRRLINEFNKGETRYYDQAQRQIRSITEPQLGVSVPNVFLPDSEVQYHLHWRNVNRVELSLYAVELNRDVRIRDRQVSWLDSIDLTTRERVRTWEHAPSPAESASVTNHLPMNANLRLEGKLKPGAYVIEATAGGKRARDLILVTDAALVLKTSGRQALVYFCNALDGSPVADAPVKLWEQWWENGNWHVRDYDGRTGTNGIHVFELDRERGRDSAQFFASAIREDRQAFAVGHGYRLYHEQQSWRIHAFTDRPAYRPGETVQWKFVARRFNGSVYSTPSEEEIAFDIMDPRGAKVKSEKVVLNTFGSAWGTLELTREMPLGEYTVVFFDASRKTRIGQATLFRLEEYKLPEFKVSVETAKEEVPGSSELRRKAFRLGETVEAVIQAEYYFGGPVANANVEVIVYQNPFWQIWKEPRPFPWYYENRDEGFSYGRRGRGFGSGQIVKREVLKTDATGKATIRFDTPANAAQDFEYRIEARVTDASRREIVGNGTVRVTRQRYYVHARAEHNLYRPQDKVTVNFRALDANDQPMVVDGLVKVTRDYWFEIWIAPDGREVQGDELKQLQARMRIWPPPPERPDQKGWRLKFRGYQHDDILTRTLKTDTNGTAVLEFTPEREGYYRVAWSGEDPRGEGLPPVPIRAETTVWVADNRSTDLGYRHGGVEIIVDKDTFRVGQTAPVMLVANAAGRYVLFTTESEDLHSYQLVHLTGTVKLVELPIEEKHVPNVFLSATLVSDRMLHVDTEEVIVPPTKNFLTVEVEPDRGQYQPRDEGTLIVRTTDDQGKPVAAEVALGLVDESVYYIQQDYGGDPRQFFFGTKRGQHVQTQGTMQQKSYARLVRADDALIDELEIKGRAERAERDRFYKTEEFAGENVEGVVDSFGGVGGALARNRVTSPLPARDMAAATAFAAQAPMAMAEPAGLALAGQDEPAVVVRSDFRSTALWQPAVATGPDGRATVKLKYPDSTTSWKATARAVTALNQFGIAETNTRTRQPLIVRLQAPRFFVVGDTVTISAVINNNTGEEMVVRPDIEFGGALSGVKAVRTTARGDARPAGTVTVPANGEGRADWVVQVTRPGEARIKVTGRAPGHADAMERSYMVYEHGIDKLIVKSGKARANDIRVRLDLPAERKPGSTTLTVQVTPSMAVTMLDALPYLIDYPYGCTEQTMSRFLPAAITARTLRDLGLEPADVMGRVFGGIETNFVNKTHAHGRTNLAELDRVVKEGLQRLYDFQHGDGGWGWWKEGESDHWMTAYVVWGLTLARDAGIEVRDDVLRRGVSFLDVELVEEEERPDMQAFMLHALSVFNGRSPSAPMRMASDNLWNRRDQLNAYTRALFALSQHYMQRPDRARVLISNLENGVKRDERPDTSVLLSGQPSTAQSSALQATAHWGEDGIYWRWSEGGVEATAFALRALLTIDPTNHLVEPVANWLIKNRRGAQWSSTRDTAIVILALNDYLKVSGELKAEADYELFVNGRSIGRKRVAGAELFAAPSRFAIDPELIRDSNEIRIRQAGGGDRAAALYFSCEARFFSQEEPIAPAGNELFVRREYYRLVGRPTLLKGYVYDREPLADGDSVR
ncbi:MAG TPA: alpha-2-macroglobulin family protein, partial [Verrucomicrobiota bacterium]|nr:alpha-2-macroglobulin family protein [Verrucomicrobiota bacterium]